MLKKLVLAESKLESKKAKDMELQYRGVRYSLNPNQMNVENAPEVGQYRGAQIRFHQPVTKLAVQQVLHLIYRGVQFDEGIGTPIA
jgi:hypothetical protein